MSVLLVEVRRDVFTPTYTLGRMYVDGKAFGYTCEDTVREDPNPETPQNEAKVYGETAIPEGGYDMQLSYSDHFDRVLPEILSVPGFKGIRIHGGNRASDSLGCILLGAARTADGCANCAPIVQKLIKIMEEAEAVGQRVRIEIK